MKQATSHYRAMPPAAPAMESVSPSTANALLRPLNILLLAVEPKWSVANTLKDHVAALQGRSRHRVFVLQNHLAIVGPFRGLVTTIPRSLALEQFDVLAVHYSNYMALSRHFDDDTRRRVRDFQGLKVAFIQDEYRTVDATVACLRDMGFDVLFTCVPEQEVEKVYPASVLGRLRKVSTLTGFVPEPLTRLSVPAIAGRKIHVGYRARVVPYWLGELGVEKWEIAESFNRHAQESGLVLDVSCEEGDRLYGDQWTDFLLSCKAVLGVESGASVFDFTGELQRDVDRYVAANPGATFKEVQERFLLPHEGKIRLNQISPRCFEAAALRTAMVLYEGDYSGILKPWQHYIPLRKDFGNFDEVVNALKEDGLLQEVADRAYREVALNPLYSYESFVNLFDSIVEEEFAGRGDPYRPAIRHARDRALWRATLLPRFLGFLSRAYVRLIPEAVRSNWRPLVRKLMARD